MARSLNIIAALDLGSQKTSALICRPLEGAKLEVLGLGSAESKGWRKGVIVNLETAGLAVKEAVEKAEAAAEVPIESAYVGISGSHLKGFDSHGAVSLGSHRREVTREDVERVIDKAKSVSLPQDRELLDVQLQQYTLDTQNGIFDPLGMMGTRLEVDVHLITVSSTAFENVIRVVNNQGVRVPDSYAVFEPLAAAQACLTAEERELGVALLDIGAGSTGVVVYRQRAVEHAAVVPVGGDHFTNDIAVGLRTPVPEAEKMKCAWGERPADPTATIEIPSVGERPSSLVTYSMLTEIIEPRAFELLELVQEDLARSGLDRQLPRGLVLTGGGAKLGGLIAMAERVFELPVRLGVPTGLEKIEVNLSDPGFTVLVGLAIHGNRQRLVRTPQERGWTDRLWGMLGGNA